jgi:hypothetical protein
MSCALRVVHILSYANDPDYIALAVKSIGCILHSCWQLDNELERYPSDLYLGNEIDVWWVEQYWVPNIEQQWNPSGRWKPDEGKWQVKFGHLEPISSFSNL